MSLASIIAMILMFLIPAVGAFFGFDLAYRFFNWRIRQIVREELVQVHIVRKAPTGVTHWKLQSISSENDDAPKGAA